MNKKEHNTKYPVTRISMEKEIRERINRIRQLYILNQVEATSIVKDRKQNAFLFAGKKKVFMFDDKTGKYIRIDKNYNGFIDKDKCLFGLSLNKDS